MISNFERARGLTMLLGHAKLRADQIRAFQDRRLRQLVKHAYENVPFYRALYDDHGVDPRAIRGVADIGRLPITSKRMFQSLPMEMRLARGTDQSRLILRKTSGSSGQPFVFARSLIEERFLGWVRLRAMLEMGSRLTYRHASVLVNHKRQRTDKQLPLGFLKAFGLMRGGPIDCFQEPQVILDELKGLAPDVIIGFPGILSRVATCAQSQGESTLRPRLILCGGETVTPLMRKQIEQGFGAPLCDTYGCVEFNLIAWQCGRSSTMHTCDYGVIPEVLSGEQPTPIGERGEMVLTGLHSFAMPLIRYRIGDVVTRGSAGCSCESAFGTISAIQGRMTDHFQLPDGRLLHPWKIIISLFHDPKVVSEVQLLQETRSRVVVRIVPQRPITASELNVIRAGAAGLLGLGVTLDIQLVDRIPLEATGKFRTSRSLVESKYDNFSLETAGAA